MKIDNNREQAQLSPYMAELNTLAKKDLEILEVNLKEKALAVPGLKMKWIRMLYEEERYLRVLKEKKQELIINITKAMIEAGVPNLKCQRDVKALPEVGAFDTDIKDQQEVVRFIEDINGIWKQFGFDIKACVEIARMETF